MTATFKGDDIFEKTQNFSMTLTSQKTALRSSLKDDLPVMPNAQKVFFADEALVRFRESSENSRSPDRELS